MLGWLPPRPTRHAAIARAAAVGLKPKNAASPIRGRKPPPPTEDPAFKWLSQVLTPRLSTDGSIKVLDAGTGPDSLLWMASLPVASITAVTACDGMCATVEAETLAFINTQKDKVLVGNWQDPSFLRGEAFDFVLADYLLGAVDHFAPDFQDGVLRRVGELVKPGGYLAIIGREPFDPVGAAAIDPAAKILVDIQALKDAATLLTRHRSYREMPQRWVEAQLSLLGFQLVVQQQFPHRLNLMKVRRLLDWAQEEIQKVPHMKLKDNLRSHLNELRLAAEGSPSLRRNYIFGEDYGLLAQRTS